ncbi:DUF2254 domain-containing protein [Agromyces neolithicus]|uniref:DUF2254 domain-containing protein n=1 Tax=Agromyces neolithicus TaxID=269420 RepID=A0ABN2M829_9MICO
MTWRTRFRRKENILEGLWAIPILGALAGVILGSAVSIVDGLLITPFLWQYSPSTASAVLTSIVGATAALTGFVVTVTVLVVQMATGTFSARIMRLWYRDPLLKATLAILVGTLTFSFAVLSRIGDDFVPNLGVTSSGALVALCLLVFIVFFDRCIRRLRPAAVAADVARTARATFRQTLRLADRPDIRWDYASMRADPSLIVRANRGGAIQAIDPDGLVVWARTHGSELVLPHPVGDFVHTGEPVVLVFGGEFGSSAAAELEGMIALGDERTFDQDPTFALRMMVDIANKALSPAVNDPTTAVQVLDHIGDVLGLVGRTDLELRTKTTGPGVPAAVVIVTRRWEDLVMLGLTEIREFGATSVQVVRRLRAVLEELLATVRPEHRAAIEEELRRLDATVMSVWRTSVDLDRACGADRQGLGGVGQESPGRGE